MFDYFLGTQKALISWNDRYLSIYTHTQIKSTHE